MSVEAKASGYRFIGNKIAPISSEQEVSTIEEALDRASPIKPVSAHLARPLQMLADRDYPDYRNSIKESISAVASLCSLIVGKGGTSLGAALTVIESGGAIHGALGRSRSSPPSIYRAQGGLRQAPGRAA